MIDCGEGTQIQLRRYKVKLSRINVILISHLHGDHYLGLTGLLNTMHLYGRQAQLEVIGPPGLKEILSLQFKLSQTTLTYPIEFKEWIPNQTQMVYDDPLLTVETIPLDHKIDCCGYHFKEKPKSRKLNREAIPEQLPPSHIAKLKQGKDILNEDGSIKYRSEDVTLPPQPSYSYAFCSDTRYLPTLAEKLQGTTVIYHEASFLEDMADRAKQTNHSTAKPAAMVARDANAQKLLLGHFSSRYHDLGGFLKESKELFDESALATEGEVFTIGV